MVMEISVAIIAIAFAALVLYVIALIKALRVTLGQVNQTLVEVRKQLDEIGNETKEVIAHTNQLSFDLKQKMESLDSLFKTVANVGDVLEHQTASLKKRSVENKHAPLDFTETEKKTPTPELIKVADILELAGMGIRLWQKLKKRR
jgi:uncharacterized protein YoxC